MKAPRWKTIFLTAALLAGAGLSPGQVAQLTDFEPGTGIVVVRGTGKTNSHYELQWSPVLGESANWTWAGETLARADGQFEVVDDTLACPGFYRVAEKESISARNILPSAIDDGMDTYSRFLWSNRIIAPPDDSDYDVFLSGDAFTGEHVFGGAIGKEIDLLEINRRDAGEVACTWIPPRYWNSPVEDAKWVYVKSKDSAHGNQDTVIGRYAYACFDMSGGLDANLLGRTAAYNDDADIVNNRTNIANIPPAAFKILPDFKPGRAEYLNLAQEEHGNFDSLYDLAINASEAVYPNGLDNLVPCGMSIFRGSLFDTGTGSWVQPKASDEISRTEWEYYLTQSDEDAFQGINVADVAKAILDYVSTNQCPAGTDYPSPKNVPMFNEIQVRLKYTEEIGDDSANRKLEITITPEFWYPFPSKDNANGPTCTTEDITVSGGQSIYGNTDIWIPMALRPLSGGPPVFVTPEAQTATGFTVSSDWNSGKPKIAGPWNCTLEIYSTNLNSCVLLLNGFKFMQPLKLTAGSEVADLVFKSDGDKPNLMSSVTYVQPNTTIVIGAEVPDPRFNHNSTYWVRYKGEGFGTLGDYNKETILAIKATGISEPDVGHYAMYCRNGPMETPGELGFIPVGTWQTLDLFSIDAANLMRHVASSNETAAMEKAQSSSGNSTFYANGTINPNTHLTNVLSAAFRAMTVWGIPNWENTTLNSKAVSEDAADFIAGTIIEATKKGDYDQALGKGHAFGTSSDWVSAFTNGKYNFLANHFPRKNVREGLVRQTWGLFRPEDTLFTIVVVAQAIKEGQTGTIGQFDEADDMVIGEKRAAVLVWREPFPLETSRDCEMQSIAYKEFK